ncbi:MAG: nucleotidyl transferase AbiEii/AbiGii toxin family protein [Nitrospirae bacterium]|nr:nucleotidyl transferase AbiEii/AbiGii toxin family protein [Nitrospirota bacterium]
MKFNEKALIHNKESFSRDVLVKRFNELGFNNLARMELFLWDLEIYLQIQDILQDKVVLKGGTAAQFYLPIDYQRTSIDIDMVCSVDEPTIQSALSDIERKFDGEGSLFKFRPHNPETPKTALPLLTYYLDVPSVCSGKELFSGSIDSQEIKIEFFMHEKLPLIHRISSPNIFAFETDKTYQILPLNVLTGDKLTTLGPNTIGIPLDRFDEYIKQTYDIDALINFQWEGIDFNQIKEYFMYRAKLESSYRHIDFKINNIVSDILAQMKDLSSVDIDKNEELKKLINDFQSLYLRKSIIRSVSEWAIVGAKLHILLEFLFLKEDGKDKLRDIFALENKLAFEKIQGVERGKIIGEFNDTFSHKFEKYSKWTAKILKGKNPKRIFWAVISSNNIEEVGSWINDFIKSKKLSD